LNHPIFDTLAADTEDGAAWSQQRIWLAQLVRSQSFETVMGLVIMVNLVLLG